LEKGGVMKGGILAARGSDDFATGVHPTEGETYRGISLACQFGKFLWAQRSVSLFESLEKLLSFSREVCASIEQGAERVGVFFEPLDRGDTRLVFPDLIAQVRSFLAEVVFGGGEDALVLIIRVLGDEQAGAGSGDDADGASTAIESIVRGTFLEVADKEDGTAGALGQLGQGSEDGADILVTGGVNIMPQNGHERVQDDQEGVGLLDGLFQEFQILGEGEGTVDDLHLFGIEALDGVEQQDAGRVASCGFQAGFERIGGAIFGGDQDNASLLAGCPIGHGES